MLQKRVKSKSIVDDVDEDESVFDDAEYPPEGSGEPDDPMVVDGPEQVRSSQSSGFTRG